MARGTPGRMMDAEVSNGQRSGRTRRAAEGVGRLGRLRTARRRNQAAASEGLSDLQVDEPALLVAEAHVDAGDERLRERDAEAAPVAVAEGTGDAANDVVVQAELSAQLAVRDEHTTRLAERHAVEPDPPPVEEVELRELEAVLAIHERPGRAHEAVREEAAQRVVAAELLELPERDVPLRPEDEAAAHPQRDDVGAPEEREETADVAPQAGELEVAAERPVRVGHLEDRAPSPGRADHVVAGRRDQREADWIDVAAMDAREVTERIRRERPLVVTDALADAHVAHPSAQVEGEVGARSPSDGEECLRALELVR